MEPSRYLYEKSLSYRGYLIIPFVFSRLGGEFIYSYALLSQEGYRGKFHREENPAQLYADTLENIITIAQQHLDDFTQNKAGRFDYFSDRYTYQNNLIVIHCERGKCFYDHYSPKNLTNIAAPKLFFSVLDCIDWVKAGLDRSSF